MTETVVSIPDLSDTPCSVAECLETAHVMGRATLCTSPAVNAPPDFALLTLGLPLCSNHAQLLRMGCTLDHFHSGL
jgi:hypothetical protein